jgi:hypothetical protein
VPEAVRTDVLCGVADQLDMRPGCVVSQKDAGPTIRTSCSLFVQRSFVGAWVQGRRDRLLHSGRDARSEGWECRMLNRSLRRRRIGQRRH